MRIEFYGMFPIWIILFFIMDLKIFKASNDLKHFGILIFKSNVLPLYYIWINFIIECIKAIRRSGRKKEVVENAEVQHQISE